MKTEKASYQQSGFSCSTCKAHVKTYNGDIPEVCPSCGAIESLTMEWNQHIDMTAVVTQLPLKGLKVNGI